MNVCFKLTDIEYCNIQHLLSLPTQAPELI